MQEHVTTYEEAVIILKKNPEGVLKLKKQTRKLWWVAIACTVVFLLVAVAFYSIDRSPGIFLAFLPSLALVYLFCPVRGFFARRKIYRGIQDETALRNIPYQKVIEMVNFYIDEQNQIEESQIETDR